MPDLEQMAVSLLIAGAAFAALSAVLLGALAKSGTQPLQAGHIALRNLDRYLEKRHRIVVKGAALVRATLFAAGAVLLVVGIVGQWSTSAF